jgi:DNA replication initiation complex subunit (GINS family)
MIEITHRISPPANRPRPAKPTSRVNLIQKNGAANNNSVVEKLIQQAIFSTPFVVEKMLPAEKLLYPEMPT